MKHSAPSMKKRGKSVLNNKDELYYCFRCGPFHAEKQKLSSHLAPSGKVLTVIFQRPVRCTRCMQETGTCACFMNA